MLISQYLHYGYFLIERTLHYSYSKQENFTVGDPEMLQFTHLLMEAKSKYSPNIKPCLKTYDIIDYIDGFSHITINNNLLPPIKIKTKPTIFIMKRKSNIKYDPNKARMKSSIKMDFENQVDDTENINTLLEEEIANKIWESIEELEEINKTTEQNLSDIELETKNGNDTMEEKVEMFNDLADNMTSTENTIESLNKLSTNSKNINKENVDSLENFEDISDISDVKTDKKTTIEEENIKGKSKSGNLRQETQGVKEIVKKMIQEKKLEAKQKKEINNFERKNIELTIKPMKKKGVTADMSKRIEELKVEKNEPINTIMVEPMIKTTVTEEHMKDDEFNKQKSVTQKKDKIKMIKSSNVEQIEDIMKEEDKIVDVKVDVKKIAKSQDKTDEELSEEKIVQEEDKEKYTETSKSINVRESIRNIINQFKEFEKDFIHDDTNIITSTNDTIESDSHIMEMDSTESSGQVMVKDARESLKEIIDQFKYIKHELTSEEDDQFDEIAAKYMERPIAETLLQFNEALKALIQRRKKTSSKEHATNLHDNRDIPENQRKPM